MKEGDALVPAAETPYAKDPSFGFASSNLEDYIREKMGAASRPRGCTPITLEDIRRGGPEAVAEKLADCRDGSFCVVNACERSDMDVVALAVFRAVEKGKRFLFRTAAAIIPALIGLAPRPLLGAGDFASPQSGCGLIVVGSFVHVVASACPSAGACRCSRRRAGRQAPALRRRKDRDRTGDGGGEPVGWGASRHGDLHEPRPGDGGHGRGEHPDPGRRGGSTLIEIVLGIQAAPRYVLAKGGITSHDIAAKALGVQGAVVMGQIIPGVPVWRLGEGSRYPGMNYIVFPGNVGTETSMTDVVQTSARMITNLLAPFLPGCLSRRLLIYVVQ